MCDGYVCVDVIQVVLDVLGFIMLVQVVDNQEVKCGQVLFVIDQVCYVFVEWFVEVMFVQCCVMLVQVKCEYVCNLQFGNLVVSEQVEESCMCVEQGEVSVVDVQVLFDIVKLNLQCMMIVSFVDGYLNDCVLCVGEYVLVGCVVLLVVDCNLFCVDGYFEEIKLCGIYIGQLVDIIVMGELYVLCGYVQSIVVVIEDCDCMQGVNLLLNVNLVFSWVWFVQCVLVCVVFDEVFDDFWMIVGCIVIVLMCGVDVCCNDNVKLVGVSIVLVSVLVLVVFGMVVSVIGVL